MIHVWAVEVEERGAEQIKESRKGLEQKENTETERERERHTERGRDGELGRRNFALLHQHINMPRLFMSVQTGANNVDNTFIRADRK